VSVVRLRPWAPSNPLHFMAFRVPEISEFCEQTADIRRTTVGTDAATAEFPAPPTGNAAGERRSGRCALSTPKWTSPAIGFSDGNGRTASHDLYPGRDTGRYEKAREVPGLTPIRLKRHSASLMLAVKKSLALSSPSATGPTKNARGLRTGMKNQCCRYGNCRRHPRSAQMRPRERSIPWILGWAVVVTAVYAKWRGWW
jgi:hypothetical protein